MQKGCPKCGRMIDGDFPKCPYCNYNFAEINNFFYKKKENHFQEKKYAGFIKRLIAGLFDNLILSFLLSLMFLPIAPSTASTQGLIITSLIYIFVYILYNSICERTSWHGSLGKKILQIEVVDEYENPVTFPRALKRNIYKIVNVLTLGIGFIMCSFKNKQALNDKLAKTNVINKLVMQKEEDLSYSFPIKRFVAYLIDIIIIYGFCFIIVNIITKITTTNKIPVNTINILNKLKYIFPIIIGNTYFPFCETKSETIGKNIFHIKIVNLDGEKISFIKSFIRQYFILLDFICLGFLLPFVTKKRQTLKDIIFKTIVINN